MSDVFSPVIRISGIVTKIEKGLATVNLFTAFPGYPPGGEVVVVRLETLSPFERANFVVKSPVEITAGYRQMGATREMVVKVELLDRQNENDYSEAVRCLAGVIGYVH